MNAQAEPRPMEPRPIEPRSIEPRPIEPRPRSGLARSVGKAAYRGLILVAILANVALVAYVATMIVPRVLDAANGTAVASPTPRPSASAEPLSPMAAIGVPSITANANCRDCHSAPGETNPRPVMAHPLQGWTNCTECHLTATLVAAAPGHSSLHKDECLVCHVARTDQDPAPKPHHAFNGTNCTSCHGNPEIPQAPLPREMTDKNNCWVCHTLSDQDLLGFTPAASGGAAPSPRASGGSIWPLVTGGR